MKKLPKLEGLGDAVELVAKVTGVAKVVKAIKPDCGCGKRRDALNKQFPFKKD